MPVFLRNVVSSIFRSHSKGCASVLTSLPVCTQSSSIHSLSSSILYRSESSPVLSDHGKRDGRRRGVWRTQRRCIGGEAPVKPPREEFPYPLKYIKVRTMEGLFQQEMAEGGGKTPPLGLVFNIAYVDTGFPADRGEFDPNVDENGRRTINPTVLCVHGAGGNHKDHAAVIKALAARGARVLAPVFPGFSGPTAMDATEMYTHTLEENVHFLVDFLRELGVTKLDLVVAFSAGCHAAVPLASRQVFDVRGMALLQIPGHRVYKGLEPYRIKKFFINLMAWKFVRQLLAPVAFLGFGLFGRGRRLTVDQMYVMGQTGYGVDFAVYQTFVGELLFSKLPLLITFSEDDEYVESAVSYEFTRFLNLRPEELTIHDAEGGIFRQRHEHGDREQYIRCLVFQKGGHFAQRRQPTVGLIVDAVEELYATVMGENRRRHQEMLTFYDDRPFGYLPPRPNAKLMLK